MVAAKLDKKAHTKRLVLLDTHAILHRAFHAIPDFSSSKGEPTGALYGLVSMLVRILTELQPDYIAAAFDLPKATYRHEAFEGYKKQRPKTDEALVLQINRSRDVLAAFGIPIYQAEGFEADDVLGTIVEKLKKDKNTDIIIASGDMDTMQLIDDKKVRVYTIKKGINDTILYDEEAVRARFGFGPEHIADYKGFRGDPSDNIPGVKGIGEKTATALITAFGSLDEVYRALTKDPESAGERAGLTKRLVEKLIAEEEEARFSKMLAEIRRDAPVPFILPTESWKSQVEVEKLMALLTELEFRSLVPRVKTLIGFTQDSLLAETQEEEVTKPEEEIPKDELALALLSLWVIDSNFTDPSLEDIYRFTKKQNFKDACVVLDSEIKKRKLEFVFNEIEKPLLPILRRMERWGVLVDLKFLKDLAGKYRSELEKLQTHIYAAAGGEFNLNSPKQLGDVLFTQLGLSNGGKQKKTATGQASTRESELEKLRDAHPIVSDVLAYRELQKLLSTYIDTIPTMVDEGARLHTRFVETGTTTGRLSSKDPNLQNIPVKSDLGRAIRGAFIAPPGFVLAAFDYSQIELRVAAILSGDEKLIEIFKSGRDVHAEVAARVFAVDSSAVTPEMRRKAKVINFGILYGMGVNALRENLGTDRKEAQAFYQQYFATFTRLAEYLEEVKAHASKTGYTETLFGRRRYFEGIRSPIPYIRASAERMAINAPIQGTQSDIIKLAMITIDALLEKEGKREDAHLILQVHDEIIFEVKEEALSELAPRILSAMADIVPSNKTKGVPIIAKALAGSRWSELKPLL